MALRGIGVRDILVLGNGPPERDALQASLAAHLGPPLGPRASGWEGLQVQSVMKYFLNNYFFYLHFVFYFYLFL